MIGICKKNKNCQLTVSLIALTLVLLVSLFCTWHIGAKLTTRYTSNIDAVIHIKLELTNAHLSLEDCITGDISRSLDSTVHYIDNADCYANALLNGDRNNLNTYLPVSDSQLRQQIEIFRQQIQVFKDTSIALLNKCQADPSIPDDNQQYRAMFRSIIAMTSNIEQTLKQNIKHDTVMFQCVLSILIATAVLAALLIAIAFRHYNQQNKISLQTIAQTNEKLQLQNEECESLIYAISHDLKSPTVTIVGFLKYIKQDLEGFHDESTLDAIERIEKAALRMRASIDDLLELSRIGRVDLDIEQVDTQIIIETVAKDLDAPLTEAQANLNITGEFPLIQADTQRLTDVFDNLISNAIKYACTQPGAQIDVHGESSATHVTFSVKDYGPGIDPAFHEKVFGLFNRLDSTRNGTGVGLTVVKRIVEVHGGTITIDSAEGKGATFTFTLPIKSHLPLKSESEQQRIKNAFDLFPPQQAAD